MILTRNKIANRYVVRQRRWNKAVPPEEVTLNGAKARLDRYILDMVVKYQPLCTFWAML